MAPPKRQTRGADVHCILFREGPGRVIGVAAAGRRQTMRRVLEVDRGDARLRLDRLLVARLPDAAGLSRTRLAAWIRAGRVEVDGVPATRAAQRLRPGQAIALDLPEPPPRPHLAEARPLTVLYEDDALLAIDKPAGLVMHPTRRHPSGTLMNALLAHLARPGGAGRVHLVHRLDRETSGIVLVAKSPAVHATLARAMARRAVHKDYLAVVYGSPRAPRDRIDLRMRRDPATRRMTTSRHDGLPASTEIAVLASSSEHPPRTIGGHAEIAGDTGWDGLARDGPTLTFLRCRLITGRLHQIRVHLAGVGLPIVGDPVYGEPRWKGIAEPRLRDACATFARQALHAWRLTCAHPVTGAPLAIEAPLPADVCMLVDAAGVAADLATGIRP
jgi:23S rRNA pseudouridine1911/1915/1917 synthase